MTDINRSKNSNKYSSAIAVFFLTIVAITTTLKMIPEFFLWFYFVISIITFIMYAKDKSAAKKGKWRIPEKTLHLLSIIGGWPGALIAQQKLRHKSQKNSFRVLFWLTSILNISLFIWLNTVYGREILTRLLKL